jgi:phosphoglycolate phosphatase-like HAD superfamily hydrolase
MAKNGDERGAVLLDLDGTLVGDEREAELGDRLREAHGEQFDRLAGEIAPLAGASELLTGHVPRPLPRPAGRLPPGRCRTTADDVETSKPAPDLIQVAKEKARTRAVAMVGDSPWDVEAGAEIVVASLPEPRDRLEETSLDRGT